MNFNSQKIFTGVVDFLAILMPGTFLSYLAWVDPLQAPSAQARAANISNQKRG